ncbi:hypothetical protein M9Y10_010479 [Tritrichomonas musculus]|uniref:Initiator binding domain-containing protein n=1 Tax=Tritrichomonas musculus TaxID=1915356 RepID=A0ABR2IKW1_9EUKA
MKHEEIFSGQNNNCRVSDKIQNMKESSFSLTQNNEFDGGFFNDFMDENVASLFFIDDFSNEHESFTDYQKWPCPADDINFMLQNYHENENEKEFLNTKKANEASKTNLNFGMNDMHKKSRSNKKSGQSSVGYMSFQTVTSKKNENRPGMVTSYDNFENRQKEIEKANKNQIHNRDNTENNKLFKKRKKKKKIHDGIIKNAKPVLNQPVLSNSNQSPQLNGSRSSIQNLSPTSQTNLIPKIVHQPQMESQTNSQQQVLNLTYQNYSQPQQTNYSQKSNYYHNPIINPPNNPIIIHQQFPKENFPQPQKESNYQNQHKEVINYNYQQENNTQQPQINYFGQYQSQNQIKYQQQSQVNRFTQNESYNLQQTNFNFVQQPQKQQYNFQQYCNRPIYPKQEPLPSYQTQMQQQKSPVFHQTVYNYQPQPQQNVNQPIQEPRNTYQQYNPQIIYPRQGQLINTEPQLMNQETNEVEYEEEEYEEEEEEEEKLNIPLRSTQNEKQSHNINNNSMIIGQMNRMDEFKKEIIKQNQIVRGIEKKIQSISIYEPQILTNAMQQDDLFFNPFQLKLEPKQYWADFNFDMKFRDVVYDFFRNKKLQSFKFIYKLYDMLVITSKLPNFRPFLRVYWLTKRVFLVDPKFLAALLNERDPTGELIFFGKCKIFSRLGFVELTEDNFQRAGLTCFPELDDPNVRLFFHRDINFINTEYTQEDLDFFERSYLSKNIKMMKILSMRPKYPGFS